MAPYRSPREQRAAPPAPLPSLVADMVQQFADPYAFLRELVQNGMDAEARRISVRVEMLPDAVCSTSVSDDGRGMSREDIEGPLLTLFSSSKEGDTSKIGKYGVGFVSVFAIQPALVEVDTWRSGQAWLLRLRGDCSYELEDAGPRPGSGTRVSLLQQMQRDAFAGHAARARAALLRWCRHAQCEIDLRVVDHEPHKTIEASEASVAERIDTPLSVVAPVSVTAVEKGTTFVVGPSAGAHHLEPPAGAAAAGPEHGPSFAGFYNRGLTLFETSDEVFSGLSGVRFKVMSPRFQHTLSRDNLRRDEAFRSAIARVRELVEGPLRGELAARLAQAAGAAAAGREVQAYVALLEAALSQPTALHPDDIPFPLASPLDGASDGTSARAGRLRGLLRAREPLLTAEARDALTEALARAGRPVVLCRHPAIEGLLDRCFPGLRIEEARAMHLLLRDAPPEDAIPGDAALLQVVAGALARVRRGVASARLGTVEGALQQRAAILMPAGARGDAGAAPRLCSAHEVKLRAARWRKGHTLYLNVASETVALARRRASVDPVTAGYLLARSLLVEARGPLDPDESDRLLDLG